MILLSNMTQFNQMAELWIFMLYPNGFEPPKSVSYLNSTVLYCTVYRFCIYSPCLRYVPTYRDSRPSPIYRQYLIFDMNSQTCGYRTVQSFGRTYLLNKIHYMMGPGRPASGCHVLIEAPTTGTTLSLSIAAPAPRVADATSMALTARAEDL